MNTIHDSNQLKHQLKYEISNIFWTNKPSWLTKRYRLLKERALQEIFDDIFDEKEDDYLSLLEKSICIINVHMDIKYKYLDFIGFITPIFRILLPFIISFITLLFTIKSIRDLSVSYLFGITWPTFLTYFMCIIIISFFISMKSKKLKEKRKYAIYISKRLEQELVKNHITRIKG